MDDELRKPGTRMSEPRFDEAFRSRLHELFLWRRDVRRFRPDPLPAGLLDELIAVACTSPSVGLSQPWRFVVVDDAARRQDIVDNFKTTNAQALAAYEGEKAAKYARLKLAGLEEAPCHLGVFADRSTPQGHGLGRRSMPEMIEYSAVAAICTLWMAARAEGIGVGWVSILDPAEVCRALDIPPHWRLIGYLCIGYPEADSARPELERAGWECRRPPSEFVVRR